MSTDEVPPPTPEPSEQPEPPAMPEPPPPPIDWGYWLRRLVVCNPFFLCSAALLLFAINRLYNDPNFLSNETQNLLFNFSALQFYEILLIGTALILARRKIWYDSALLVVLENGLILLPFMLLSQAALIDERLAWGLTLAGGLAAFGRFAALKRWYSQFNLPPRAILLGVVLLALNVALPRIFRAVIAVDYYNWHLPNLIAWYVVLPVLAAGANLLPRPTRYGGLNPERHWLPLFLYALWIIGTGVHIWSVGHIAERPFEFSLLAPVVWVAAWTFWNRLSDCVPSPSVGLEKVALAIAFLAPFLAGGNSIVFTILCALNAVAFLALCLTREASFAKELALASFLLAFAGVPLGLLPLNRPEHIAAAIILYCIIAALRSPNPEIGFIGALAVSVAAAWFARAWSPAGGAQAGLVFFLVHSLRWDDENRADRLIRKLAVCLWISHALIWTRGGWIESAFVAAGVIITVSAWVFYLWRYNRRAPWIIPIASGATLLTGPSNWFMTNSSTGLVALAASFLLFALGTVLAITRHKWERRDPVQASNTQE